MSVLDAVAGKAGVIAGKTYLGAPVIEVVDACLDPDLLVDIIG